MIRAGKWIYFYISRPSIRCVSSFESAQNPANLYPGSDSNAIFKKPREPNVSQEVFNGYIPIDELQISYLYSSGPGGQHVNKNKTKVEIRFHVPSATWIPDQVKERFMEREANRINKENYFIITSDHTRKQILNQADCLERIRRIVRECENSLFKPEPNPETLEAIQRRKVKANEERLREKKEKSFTKQLRQDNHSADLF
ncbi:hypothetical protein MN116_008258 [Schistosoma mekongi]|uniref:Large ribosomal subunit protein mL62 n=1 Tax=Schistosoma mekongi TaxID=38744 RepID=A0AAE2D1U3_SCHME|nr:hypothetical protein MN116_008258 [Schistosoma mekongi]